MLPSNCLVHEMEFKMSNFEGKKNHVACFPSHFGCTFINYQPRDSEVEKSIHVSLATWALFSVLFRLLPGMSMALKSMAESPLTVRMVEFNLKF